MNCSGFQPLISVVIANYNYGRFLEDAIKSVLSQNMGDKVELIVCDGGSTDNSVDIIRKFEKDIAWWCSEPDSGQSNAFNKGFAHATGRFLTWLNADDIYMQGSLAEIARMIISYPRCDWFTGSTFWVDADKRIRKCFCAHQFSPTRARCCMMSANGPSSFFSRELFDRVGGYVDETFHYCMDTELWYRFYMRCGCRFIRTRKPIFAYRIHEDSKMSGADVSSATKAMENRKRSTAEGQRLAKMYGLDYGANRFWSKILSFSLMDFIVACFYRIKYRRRFADEI